MVVVSVYAWLINDNADKIEGHDQNDEIGPMPTI